MPSHASHAQTIERERGKERGERSERRTGTGDRKRRTFPGRGTVVVGRKTRRWGKEKAIGGNRRWKWRWYSP